MTDKIVQFICFETTLESGEFIKEWEQYVKSAENEMHITLQQSEKNGVFRYIAQYRYVPGEFQFVFSKAGKPFRAPEIEIKAKQAGGYSILQLERKNDVHANESKVFAFLSAADADLRVFKQMHSTSKLNIYEAYFESCQYAYILEFFVKNKYVAELLLQLKQYGATEIRIYKECALQTA